mmetsp:Transcript_8769/g.28840  ORF Transcript_8769/g.28840 Transcript_8769/m.28840 type:complete len:249 (+) Transcript_8769:236-982(+)
MANLRTGVVVVVSAPASVALLLREQERLSVEAERFPVRDVGLDRLEQVEELVKAEDAVLVLVGCDEKRAEPGGGELGGGFAQRLAPLDEARKEGVEVHRPHPPRLDELPKLLRNVLLLGSIRVRPHHARHLVPAPVHQRPQLLVAFEQVLVRDVEQELALLRLRQERAEFVEASVQRVEIRVQDRLREPFANPEKAREEAELGGGGSVAAAPAHRRRDPAEQAFHRRVRERLQPVMVEHKLDGKLGQG